MPGNSCAEIASEAPKNTAQSPMTSGRSRSDAAPAISGGPATTRARCATPSSPRDAAKSQGGGSVACTSDIAPPSTRPPRNVRPMPQPAASPPAIGPSSSPTIPTSEMR